MSRIVQSIADKVTSITLDGIDLRRYLQRPGLRVELTAGRVDLAHDWKRTDIDLRLSLLGLEACARCGVIRRRDDKNRLCRGPHRIDLRSTLL